MLDLLPFLKNHLISENLSLEGIFASDYINKLMVMKYTEYLLLKFLLISHHTHESLLIYEN